jgi:hypothetical protein
MPRASILPSRAHHDHSVADSAKLLSSLSLRRLDGFAFHVGTLLSIVSQNRVAPRHRCR